MIRLKTIFGGFAALLCAGTPAFSYDSVQLKSTLSTPEGLKNFTPTGAAVDASGRLWITDPANHQILLYSATGELVLRTGKAGQAPGDFQEPHGIAVDAQGNAYVADSGNQRIQVFTPDGKPSFVFGEKGSEPGQLKTPWLLDISADGTILVSEKEGSRVQLFSKDGIFLRLIETGAPIDGLAIDASGRIYVTHTKLKQIEQWSSVGQLIRTFLGQEHGVKPWSKPQNLAVSNNGMLYVGDPGSSQFRELDLTGHTQGVFGRSGNGDGQFKSIDGIAVHDDRLYICDSRNRRVVSLLLTRSTQPPMLTPVPASRLQVNRATGIDANVDRLAWNPGGMLHALSFARSEVVTYDAEGKVASTLDLKKELGIKQPSGLTTAPSSGALFVSDSGEDRVVKLDKDGKKLLEFGKSNAFFKSGQGDLSNPEGLACSPQGVLFVANTGNSRFDAFNHQGLFQFTGGEKGSAQGQLKSAVAIAWDKEKIYVADPGNKKVAVFNTTGRFLHDIGVMGPEPFVDPRQVAVDKEGNLFVLDAGRGRVLAFDAQGVYIGGFGHPGRGVGALNKPRSFALSDNGELHIAEEGRIQGFHVVLLPPAPTGLAAKAGEGYVSLKWEPVKTRYPAKYLLYRSLPSGESTKIKETVETTAIDDALTANTTYTYNVVAQSVQGASSVPSAPVVVMGKEITSGPRLEITSAQVDDVFSAHYKYYGRVPLGKVTIKNNGMPPARKIRVSFAIQGYMDYPTETAIEELRSGEEKEVPLLATFNNRILEVTETTPIQAQVKLVYYNGDQEATFTKNFPFKLYSRNTIRWDNKERFSAFVTPNDPPVIDFARGAAIPFTEAHKGAPMPPALISAWSVFSGLSTYGITYVPRPNNPYDHASLDATTVDSLQFARETLGRKSGDCADVVALLASALESLTVTTAALDAPGHLFLMFDTGESQKDALAFPEGWLVSYAGTYWIPIEATMLGSPFLEAWKQGAEQYRRWAKEDKVTPIDIHKSWKTFEPATLPEMASGAKAPSREAIEEKFLTDWRALVALRWDTAMAAAKAASAAAPTSGEPWMRMGFLAIEYKRYDEARQFFKRAINDSSTSASASNNLGNLSFIAGDTAAAQTHYEEALKKDPKDPEISINLARVYLKTGHPQKAATAFDRAVALEPSLHSTYPDVSSLAP